MSTMTTVDRISWCFVLPAQETSQTALVRRLEMSPALRAQAAATMNITTPQGLGAPLLGVAPIPDSHIVRHGPKSDLVLVDPWRDHLYHDRDGFPIPERILRPLRRHIEALNGAGLDYDAIYHIHEVPPGAVREGGPIPDGVFVPPPSRCAMRHWASLGSIALGAYKAAALPLLAVGAISAGLAAAAVAAGPLLVGYDPAVLGVVVAPGRPVAPGEPAAWFALAAWRWNEGEE